MNMGCLGKMKFTLGSYLLKGKKRDGNRWKLSHLNSRNPYEKMKRSQVSSLYKTLLAQFAWIRSKSIWKYQKTVGTNMILEESLD